MPGAVRRHWPLAAVVAALFLAWQPLFVGPALIYNEDVLQGAVAVYAILRTINAALSVAKETEVGFEFFGSVTAQPAMVLDPIDETVARVSDAIFMLLVASGLLKVALAPLAQIGAFGAALGFGLIYGRGAVGLPLRSDGVGRSLIIGGLIFAVALPLVYGVGGQIAARTTDRSLQEAREALQGSAETIEEVSREVRQAAESEQRSDTDLLAVPDNEDGEPGKPKGFADRVMDQAQGILGRANNSVSAIWSDVGERIGNARRSISDSIPGTAEVDEQGSRILESSITIVAIYAFRLIVLPLVLLWIALALLRRTLG